MFGSRTPQGLRAWTGGLTLGALLALPQLGAAQSQQSGPTYATDIAPILNQKCVECHRPNSIAPMSLMSYDQAKQYAPLIKFRVANRIMPPWHINPNVGIQKFKNFRGLTAKQRQTIVKWVDDGAPEGDPSQIPATPTFRQGKFWRLADIEGQPDIVIKSAPYDLPAITEDKWWRPVTETGVKKEHWIKAIEIRPANPESRTVIHHTLASLVQDENPKSLAGVPPDAQKQLRGPGLLMEWAVGKAGQIFPNDAGKLILPGSKIAWEVHMHASGKEVKDVQAELGLWYRKDKPRFRTILTMFNAVGNGLDIPPGKIAVTQQHHVLQAPARLSNFQPHMHMRGKAMSMELIYPDGHREVVAFVDNFQWNWQINYIFADDATPLVPKGTDVVITAWHDNRPENPSNPDPRQWLAYGDRTVDEMSHDWTDVTYLSQDYYEQLVAQRKQKVAEEQQQQ